MSKTWSKVRLGEVLLHRKEFVIIDDLKVYKRPRVQLHAQGVMLRDEVPGTLIKTKQQQVCRVGEFLVAEIDAKVGGFGFVPLGLDGAIVSSHYFLFVVKEARLDGSFLEWFVKTREFRDQVAAQGSTNYAAIRPNDVLNYEISLPPLFEQRRIVARIEELASKIVEARDLRQRAIGEADALLMAALTHLQYSPESRIVSIVTCSQMSTGTTPPSERDDYFGGTVQWFTPGDLGNWKELEYSSRTLSELAVTERKARVFQPGTVLLVAIGASLGKVGLTRKICSANQQITGICFNEDVIPDYGYWWVRRLSEAFMAAAPKATLPIINQERIGQFEIAIPPIPEQVCIVAYLDGLQAQVDALKRLQAETAAELDALLPSILDKAFKGEL